MHTYEVTGPLVIFGPQQLLKLSAAQIDARLYCLEAVEDEADDVMRSTGPVQFKRGEVVAIPEHIDDLPGIIAEHLTVSGEAAEKPASKKRSGKKSAGKKADADDPESDLDALEAAVDAAEAALNSVDPADAAAVAEAQGTLDAAKDALAKALGI